MRAGHRRNAVIAALTILLVLTMAGGVGAAAFQRQVVSEGNRATARLVAAEAASVREVQPGLSKQLSLVAYRLDPDTGTPSVLDGELQSGAKWVNLGVILPGVEPGGRLESAAKWTRSSRTESAWRPLPRSTTRSGRGCATRCRPPDLALYAAGAPGTTLAGVLSLMSLHVVAAGLTVFLLGRYGLRPGTGNE